jgi:hypothetical protein
MLDFFRKQAEKARSTSKAKTDVSPKYPPAWPLCSDDHPKPRINPQTQSPLFTVLSAELRIQVYQAVLTDPPRFLHIIKNRFPARHGLQKLKKKVPERRVAHYWCTDMESPYPTWQHVCYGESLDPTSPIPRTFHRRPITETNDKLLSLLQTCRQV